MDKRHRIFGRALLMSVAAWLVAGAASAQTTPPPKKSAPHMKMAPAAPAVPALEPKAIELLKATSARLAGARTPCRSPPRKSSSTRAAMAILSPMPPSRRSPCSDPTSCAC